MEHDFLCRIADKRRRYCSSPGRQEKFTNCKITRLPKLVIRLHLEHGRSSYQDRIGQVENSVENAAVQASQPRACGSG